MLRTRAIQAAREAALRHGEYRYVLHVGDGNYWPVARWRWEHVTRLANVIDPQGAVIVPNIPVLTSRKAG